MKVMDKNKLSYVEPEINSLKINHEYSMAALSVVIKMILPMTMLGLKIYFPSDMGKTKMMAAKSD